MSKVILVVALAAAAPALASDQRARDERLTCTVDVGAFGTNGRVRPVRHVSAGVAPAVVFRGKVEHQDDDAQLPPLLFDVFNPRGQRYQVLVANSPTITRKRGGHRVERESRFREATLAVAGSSIAWTSMYGKWRIEPRIEGESKPCGRAEYFTIRP